jgi:hydroxymethylbilane synthase
VRALKIATRKSPLALWQAEAVKRWLIEQEPGLQVSLVELSTEGDRFLSAPLSQIGGKGLFVKEIEAALLDGSADLAVHSLKDMTSLMPPGLVLASVPRREDPRDAWVSPKGLRLAEVPQGASVGTSSLRRACQLLERRPDLKIVPLRGNVQTRLRKTEEQGLAGSLLALAGLRRLELESRVTEALEPEISLPAVGQGVLAIQCRVDDGEVMERALRLEHAETRLAVTAERAFLARLEGGCTVPLAGYAQVRGSEIFVRGLVGSPDGRKVVRAEATGPAAEGSRIGHALAGELLSRGGVEILAAFAKPIPES